MAIIGDMKAFSVFLTLASIMLIAVFTGCEVPTSPVIVPTITPAPAPIDADGDGWNDDQEAKAGTDPNNKDTDGDSYWDPQDANPLDENVPVKSTTAPLPTPTPTPTPTPSTPEAPQTQGGPQTLSPEKGMTTGRVDALVFAWAAVAGATEYEFVLATDAALTNTVGDTPVKTPRLALLVSELELEYGSTYFWGVRVAAPTPGPWTLAYFLTMDKPAALSGPRIVGPDKGNITGRVDDVTFGWVAVEGATEYEFVLATDAALTNTVGGTPVKTRRSNWLTVSGLEYGSTYFWGVRVTAPTSSQWTIAYFMTMDKLDASTPTPTPAPTSTPTVASTSVPASIFDVIRANAIAKWGTDTSMVQYQIDNQVEAYEWILRQTCCPEIMQAAQQKWGTDYEMVKYQYENQVEAFLWINQQTAYPEIMQAAKQKWGTDYEMVKYEYENLLAVN